MANLFPAWDPPLMLQVYFRPLVYLLFFLNKYIHVEGRDGESDVLVSSKLSKVTVEGNSLLSSSSTGNSQGDTKDGVSSILGLAVSAIQSNELLIELSLLGGVSANDGGTKNLIDILNSLEGRVNMNTEK